MWLSLHGCCVGGSYERLHGCGKHKTSTGGCFVRSDVFSHDIQSRDPLTNSTHDDVIKWNHFPRYRPFVRGIHRPSVNSPHKGQWRGALMFSLICAWLNGWVNNCKAGDLRRNRPHYDDSVMESVGFTSQIYAQYKVPVTPRAFNTLWHQYITNWEYTFRHFSQTTYKETPCGKTEVM